MIYVPKEKETQARRLVNFDAVGNISRTGSVIGMRKLYGWPIGGQVRLGSWIYNVGSVALAQLKAANLTRS